MEPRWRGSEVRSLTSTEGGVGGVWTTLGCPPGFQTFNPVEANRGGMSAADGHRGDGGGETPRHARLTPTPAVWGEGNPGQNRDQDRGQKVSRRFQSEGDQVYSVVCRLATGGSWSPGAVGAIMGCERSDVLLGGGIPRPVGGGLDSLVLGQSGGGGPVRRAPTVL
ncbi:unnamed protein product [Arctogadus glacialis]